MTADNTNTEQANIEKANEQVMNDRRAEEEKAAANNAAPTAQPTAAEEEKKDDFNISNPFADPDDERAKTEGKTQTDKSAAIMMELVNQLGEMAQDDVTKNLIKDVVANLTERAKNADQSSNDAPKKDEPAKDATSDQGMAPAEKSVDTSPIPTPNPLESKKNQDNDKQDASPVEMPTATDAKSNESDNSAQKASNPTPTNMTALSADTVPNNISGIDPQTSSTHNANANATNSPKDTSPSPEPKQESLNKPSLR